MYLFPFGEVKPNARVIIYGAGKVGLDFMRQITRSNYAQLLCMVEKDYQMIQGISDVAVPVVSRERLLQFTDNYDIILIAVLNQKISLEVKQELCGRGIPESKIILPKIVAIEDAFWGKWELTALWDAEDRQKAMEGFAREGNGKISYFTYMIAEIRLAKDKNGLLAELFRITDGEECLEYKIIMLRIFLEAGVVNGELTKKFIALVRQIEPLESRYLLLSDIAIFPVHFAECLYREFYLDLRDAYRELMESYNLQVPNKGMRSIKRAEKRAAVLFNWLGGAFNHGDFKKYLIEELAEEKFEVQIFCLDIRLWYTGMCFIEPFDDMSCKVKPSECYASSHKAVLEGTARLQYIHGRTVRQRMQESIDRLFAWNPDVIIDITDEIAPQSYILNQYFPVYYVPMRGFLSAMFFGRILSEGKRAAQYCNKFCPSMAEEQMADCYINITIPCEKERRDREEFQWGEEDFIMVTVGGRLEHELDEMFLASVGKMLRENPDIKWLLIGTEQIALLKNTYIEFLNSGQVRILKYENDLMGIFGICDVYLNPRRSGGGTTHLWAAGRGIPVVADASKWFDTMELLGWDSLCWSTKEQIAKIVKMKNDKQYYQQIKMQTEAFHQKWKKRAVRREFVKSVKEFIGMRDSQ